MAKLNQSATRALHTIKEILDAERYADLCGGSHVVRQLVRFGTSETLRQIWTTASSFSNRQKSLLMLLFFGVRTPRSSAESLIEPAVLSALVGLGILRELDGCFEAANYCFLPVNGGYLIGPRLFGFQSAPSCPLYLGYDSFILADAVEAETNALLAFEVGTGTGIASLSGSHIKTVASDIDPQAILIASANFVLNGVEDRCSAAEGDLFTGLNFGSPDLIFSNPPYVPAPPDLRLPLYSWGGEDGLDFVRRILTALPGVINQNTTCIFVLSAYGSADKTALEHLLTLTANRYRIRLRYTDRIPLEGADFEALAQGARTVNSEPAITVERFREHYRKLDFRYKYNCILKIETTGPFGLEISSDYSSQN